MKPYENFVGNLLHAVKASQGQDPAAATAIIQDALRSAGLLPSGQSPAPGAAAPFGDLNGASAFVDLNEAPAWARKKSRPGAGPANSARSGFDPGFGPGFAPDAMPDWTEHLKAFQKGHAKKRAPRDLANEPGQFLEGSFGNEAGSRNYRLYVPARPATGPRPLVVMLHGCKQDPDDFAAGTTMNALAEEHGCLVLYPEQTRSANGSGCWNWFETPHQQRDLGEPSIIAGMTRQVMREHGAHDGKVYVAGLSAGGAMAAVMAASYPELYAAVGVHSGLPVGSAHDLMSGLNAMKGSHGKKVRHGATLGRRVPAIVFHGDQDGIVHPSNGHTVFRQFLHGADVREVEARGQDGRGYTRTMAQDGSGRTVAEHWTLHGAGHAWSGGSPAGSYADASGPNASAEMLRFFLEQAG
jgi:poly(hydroxyalkanoate) depolymerase family esterase